MTDLHHVGVTVADLDRAVAFYRDQLGMAVLDRFEVGGEGFATAVDVADASASFAHLEGGGARVELVAYDPPGDERADGSLNDPGATHLALAVDDVDATVEALPEHVERLSEPQTTESGSRICFLRDPEGNLVELIDA